jgi:hypothetical protein
VIAEQSVAKDTKVLASMTVDIVTIDNARVRTVEMVNVRVIMPRDDLTLTIVNWFHISFLITPNAFLGHESYTHFENPQSRQV